VSNIKWYGKRTERENKAEHRYPLETLTSENIITRIYEKYPYQTKQVTKLHDLMTSLSQTTHRSIFTFFLLARWHRWSIIAPFSVPLNLFPIFVLYTSVYKNNRSVNKLAIGTIISMSTEFRI